MNIASILDSTVAQQTPVVLMTFAFHLPVDYSRDAFLQQGLSYGEGFFRIPVESWGPAEGVAAAVAAHNREIRDLAERREDVVFVDQHKRLSHEGHLFSDVCHLTDAGIETFVDGLVQTLLDNEAAVGLKLAPAGELERNPERRTGDR